VSREEKRPEIVAWFQRHITGDEKGQAQNHELTLTVLVFDVPS
jgi:hypothetical protein